MQSMRTTKAHALMLTALLAASASTLHAQPHDGDIILHVQDGQIFTGDADANPICTFTAALGAGDQTNDPGFDSQTGTFQSRSQITFTLLRSLREWRDGNFDTIPDEQIELSWGPLGPVTTTLDDSPAAGFPLGVSDSGQFHYHYKFKLTSPADPGIYLLTMQMDSDENGVEPSEPIYILLNQDLDQAALNEALAWWEANGAWCSADGCFADFNGDGTVNTQDFIAYLNAWTSQDPRADVNDDGTINTQDFIAYLNLWTAGC